MNRQTVFSIIFIFSISTLFVGCKEDGPIIDQEAPQITILSPKANSSFTGGTLMPIHIEINENLELHEYRIELKHVESDVFITVDAGHSHDKLVEVEKEIQVPTLGQGTFELTVEASDHDGNLGTAMVQLLAE